MPANRKGAWDGQAEPCTAGLCRAEQLCGAQKHSMGCTEGPRQLRGCEDPRASSSAPAPFLELMPIFVKTKQKRSS